MIFSQFIQVKYIFWFLQTMSSRIFLFKECLWYIMIFIKYKRVKLFLTFRKDSHTNWFHKQFIKALTPFFPVFSFFHPFYFFVLFYSNKITLQILPIRKENLFLLKWYLAICLWKGGNYDKIGLETCFFHMVFSILKKFGKDWLTAVIKCINLHDFLKSTLHMSRCRFMIWHKTIISEDDFCFQT